MTVEKLEAELGYLFETIQDTFLFELNDTRTRAAIIGMVDTFLAKLRGERQIYDYRVVCDERNNLADAIDRGELTVDLYMTTAFSNPLEARATLFNSSNTDFEALAVDIDYLSITREVTNIS